MQDLQSLETTVLIDMLAQHTKEYTALLFGDNQEGLDAHETLIFHLQEEINQRKKNTSITDTDIKFTDTDTNLSS